MDIEYVVAESSAEKQRQIEVAVTEVMACRHSELGHAVAYYLTVIVGSLRSADYVAVPVIYQPFAFGGDACIFPHIEVAEGFAFLDPLQVIERIWIFCSAHVVEVLAYIFRVAEIHEFIAHGGAYHVETVGEIACFHNVEAEVELEAGIAHGAYIDECLVEKIWRHRYLVVAEQILLASVEVVERTVYPVAEK